MENKNIALINYQQDDFTYQDDSSMYEEEEEEESVDDAMTQSAETGDKTDQEISTHELKYDDSESYQFEDVIEGDDNCGSAKVEVADDDENSDVNRDNDDEEDDLDEGWRAGRKFFCYL